MVTLGSGSGSTRSGVSSSVYKTVDIYRSRRRPEPVKSGIGKDHKHEFIQNYLNQIRDLLQSQFQDPTLAKMHLESLSNELPLLISFLREDQSTNLTLFTKHEQDGIVAHVAESEASYMRQRVTELEERLKKKQSCLTTARDQIDFLRGKNAGLAEQNANLKRYLH